MTCVTTILRKIPGISKWQHDFMAMLLPLILALPGRLTFRNMSRYSDTHERTFARQFDQSFDWVVFNRALIAPVLGSQVLVVTDCSFITKSGKQTYGLDKFWNGSLARNERGLEVSVMALIDQQTRDAYTLSVEQTPPRTDLANDDVVEGRTAFYLRHLEQVAPHLPAEAHYVAADGYYAKKTYIDGVCELGLHLISKLRCDANLRYLYRGPHQKRPGARRIYDGKVDLHDVSRLDYVDEVEQGIELYTAVVNNPHFKRNLRIAYLLDRRNQRAKRRRAGAPRPSFHKMRRGGEGERERGGLLSCAYVRKVQRCLQRLFGKIIPGCARVFSAHRRPLFRPVALLRTSKSSAAGPKIPRARLRTDLPNSL